MRLIDADAIPKEFLEYEFDGKWNGCTIKDLIDEQPTIQHEKAQLSQEGTTSDLISRQAAVDALAEQMPTPYTPDGSHPADEQIFQVQEVYVDCITTIKLLPTIQPVATDTNVGNNSEIPNSSDCISRQQAIDIVVFECGKWTGLAKEISKQLKQLPPAKPEPQWISVSERLPETGGESFFDGMVLITLKDRETGDLYVLNDKYCGDGNWLMCLPDDPTEVVAWLPLPEPYQKGAQNE